VRSGEVRNQVRTVQQNQKRNLVRKMAVRTEVRNQLRTVPVF